MEKSLRWYILSLKLHMKKKMYYFQMLVMVLVLLLVYKIQMPKLNTVEVGVCFLESATGKEIYESLKDAEDVFEYKQYTDKEHLETDVLAGQIESGFVFTKQFDTGIQNGEMKDTILFYSTPFSMKAEVLKEAIYAATFEYISDALLLEIDEEQYGNTDELRRERLSLLNDWYLESDALFELEIVEVPIEKQAENNAGVFNTKTYPIQGTAGVLVLLIMYLAYSKKWENENKAVLKALPQRDRNVYMAAVIFAGVTFPAIIATIFSIMIPETRGVLTEIIAMIVLIVISTIWIMLLGKVIKNYMTYIGSGVAILLANIICCPIFVDLAVFVPAIKYIRMLLPMGWFFLLK